MRDRQKEGQKSVACVACKGIDMKSRKKKKKHVGLVAYRSSGMTLFENGNNLSVSSRRLLLLFPLSNEKEKADPWKLIRQSRNCRNSRRPNWTCPGRAAAAAATPIRNRHTRTNDAFFKKEKIFRLTYCGHTHTHTHPVVNSFSIHRPDRSISSCGRRASADVSDKRCNTTPPATALKEEEEESHTTLLTWRCPHHTNIFPATILDARNHKMWSFIQSLDIFINSSLLHPESFTFKSWIGNERRKKQNDHPTLILYDPPFFFLFFFCLPLWS